MQMIMTPPRHTALTGDMTLPRHTALTGDMTPPRQTALTGEVVSSPRLIVNGARQHAGVLCHLLADFRRAPTTLPHFHVGAIGD